MLSPETPPTLHWHICFRLATRDADGRRLAFPPAAEAFWQWEGEGVGRLLRPEMGLTFAEVMTAVVEVAEMEGTAVPEAAEVLACLLRMAGWGMAVVEVGQVAKADWAKL